MTSERQTGAAPAELQRTFDQLRRRHARLGLQVRLLERIESPADYHATWARWSSAYDEAATIADRLVRSPPEDLDDLVGMFAALEWILLSDGAVVDSGAARQLRMFGRRLRQFAKTSHR